MSESLLPSKPTGAARPTILVVEPEVIVRLVIADFLRDCGYRVCETSNVAEARLVLDSEIPVHLVFSNVDMPNGASGFELARWIRQNRPDVEVILTSGLPAAAEKAKTLCDQGPLIPQPYDHRAVLQRIQELLRKSRHAKPAEKPFGAARSPAASSSPVGPHAP